MSARARHVARLAALLTLLALALRPAPAAAQCTGGAACPPCTLCRVPPAAGMNPDVPTMSRLFDQIAAGPTVYGALGWNFAGRTTFGAGPGWCGAAGARDTVPCTFPCILLKAIYLTESSWRQFCTTNQTVISFDCGYGIAQVTSGMRRGETSAFDPNRVASSPAYNVSVGAAILADKWRASPCVGGNDPNVIEDWYFAVWGYNGFVFRNNPNNPMFNAARPEFRTPGIASAQVRGNYPYQELVWGYAHYPLSAAHYTGIGLAYPNRSEICATCGRPTANISEPRGAHRTTCPGGPAPMMDAGVDAARPDAGRDAASDARADAAADAAGPDAGAMDASGEDGGGADSGGGGGADVARDAQGDRGSEAVEMRAGCGCTAPGGAGERARWGAVIVALAAALARRRRD